MLGHRPLVLATPELSKQKTTPAVTKSKPNPKAGSNRRAPVTKDPTNTKHPKKVTPKMKAPKKQPASPKRKANTPKACAPATNKKKRRAHKSHADCPLPCGQPTKTPRSSRCLVCQTRFNAAKSKKSWRKVSR
jgi:hypothetical protein